MKLMIHLNPIQNWVENFQLRFSLKSEVFPSLTLSTEVLFRDFFEPEFFQQKKYIGQRESCLGSKNEIFMNYKTMPLLNKVQIFMKLETNLQNDIGTFLWGTPPPHQDTCKNVFKHGMPNQTVTPFFPLNYFGSGWSIFQTDFCIETVGSWRSF